MLTSVAEFYEEEVDTAVAAFAFLDSIVIWWLWLVIGIIMVALYLPMFSLQSRS